MKNNRPILLNKKYHRSIFVLLFITGCIIVVSLTLILFSDPLTNAVIKPKLVDAFHRAYPNATLRIGTLSYDPLQGMIGLDSTVIAGNDGEFRMTINRCSVSGLKLLLALWNNGVQPEDCGNVRTEFHGIMLRFSRSGYEYRVSQLHMSVPDSMIAGGAADIRPLLEDESFFANSSLRQTRLIFHAGSFFIHGIPLIAAAKNQISAARRIQVDDVFMDVLVNIDKPKKRVTDRPKLPDEILASVGGTLQIDSLTVTNGQVRYGERFAVRSTPAVITLDQLMISGTGITNSGAAGTSVELTVEGKLMDSGKMKLNVSVPAQPADASFRLSGAVERLSLIRLNAFLEKAEQVRITSGVLQNADFDIAVRSGRAGGTVRAVYRDLSITMIDRHTGKGSGLFDVITSFIANTFKIRGTNQPDRAGAMKIGAVRYTQQPDDSPFQFCWFALRSGIKDIVGF